MHLPHLLPPIRIRLPAPVTLNQALQHLTAKLLGEYAERQVASQRILVAGIVIFFLLLISLGNWRLATISFLSLSLALVSGVIAAFILLLFFKNPSESMMRFITSQIHIQCHAG